MNRLFFALLVCCFAAACSRSRSGTIAYSGSTLHDFVVVRIRDEGFFLKEYVYAIDVASSQITWHSATKVARQSPELKFDAVESGRNEKAYLLLEKRTPNQAVVNPELAVAMKWLDERKKRGQSPVRFVAANSSGTIVLNGCLGQPMLLVNLETLETRRLIENASYQVTPVAWSPDSRHVAYAPIDADKIVVFDNRRNAVVWERDGVGRIAALSWSPDGERIAVLGMYHEHMKFTPLALLAAFSGHPITRDDAFVALYQIKGGEHSFIALVDEIGDELPDCRIEWK